MQFTRVAVLAALGLIAAGCAGKKQPATAAGPAINPAVTNVQPAAQPQPIVVTPVSSASSPAPIVTPIVSETPVSTASTDTTAGTTYTVKKGDTLSKIARARYGDLSAVRKIKEANPGLDANNIKPGQKLNLP